MKYQKYTFLPLLFVSMDLNVHTSPHNMYDNIYYGWFMEIQQQYNAKIHIFSCGM
jgi:hypothetical protein